MKVKEIYIEVNAIEFDFGSDYEECKISKEEKRKIIRDVIDNVWVIEEEEDCPFEDEEELTARIIDVITDETGWCVNGVMYEILNKVKDNVRDNVNYNVLNNIYNNVMDNVLNNIGANVEDIVDVNVWVDVFDNVRANVSGNIRNNVRDNVKPFAEKEPFYNKKTKYDYNYKNKDGVRSFRTE